MKRFGYKAVIEELEKGAVIRVNTMPYRIPERPDIGLFVPNAQDSTYGKIDKLLGSISDTTFWNLQRNYGIKRVERQFSYDVWKK